MIKLIELKNVFLDFSNQNILSNISFSIFSNRILTLIGPNGAGKSTLIRVILGLIKPNQGKIIRIPKLKIGYVPQKIKFDSIMPISVNKFMNLFKKSGKNRIVECLKYVHAEHLKYSQMNHLSGGELQRILLARALLNSPTLLILDEPDQGIDISGQIMLYKLINQLRNQFNYSILLVSHDLNLVMSHTDEVICLNNHICCSGNPEKISKNLKFISIFGDIKKRNLSLYYHDHNHTHII